MFERPGKERERIWAFFGLSGLSRLSSISSLLFVSLFLTKTAK